MSEGSDHDDEASRYQAQARDDVDSSSSASSENFLQRLRQHNTAAVPIQNSSVDVIPMEELEEDEVYDNDVNDSDNSDYSVHADAERMIPSTQPRLLLNHVVRALHSLRKKERRVSSLQTELATIMTKNKNLVTENERLRKLLSITYLSRYTRAVTDPNILPNYRLYIERSIGITNYPGCRVMVYSPLQSSLIASKKSDMRLRPGYGINFIDIPVFKPVSFLYTSTQIVRDICLSPSQQEIALTSLEKFCKLYDLRTNEMSARFQCNKKRIWSCAMDQNERENYLYLGDQCGKIHTYDIRNPKAIVSEFPSAGECSPATRIVPVQANKTFPRGGFLVCKLKAIWFYEYTDDGTVSTLLSVEGPFMSINYDATHESLLISTRISQYHSQMRFILGKLEKFNEVVLFATKITFFGSETSSLMTRANQIATESNTLVVGYLQDKRQVAIYDAQREERVQSLQVSSTVYDVCPIHLPDNIYLAALTDCKCHIYNVKSSAPT